MEKPRRPWSAIVSALCALLAGATALLWLASGWTSIEYFALRNGNIQAVSFAGGTVQWLTFSTSFVRVKPTPGLNVRVTRPAGLRFLWRGVIDRTPTPGFHIRFVIPFWWLPLVLGAYPAWHLLSFRMLRRRARFRQGLCLACGYDLRASPERCPECGSLVTDYQPVTRDHIVAAIVWMLARSNRGKVIRIIALAIALIEFATLLLFLASYVARGYGRGSPYDDYRWYTAALLVDTAVIMTLLASFDRRKSAS